MEQVKPGDLIFNIGGDTYCYGTPYISYALNELAQKAGIPTVFWGCSVDARVRQDAAMRQDLRRYAHVVAREQLSWQRLRECVEENRLTLACDPAFVLEAHPTALPKGFLEGNTVGINLSPQVITNASAEESVHNLIQCILQKTDMAICLIPHVYAQDLPILRKYDQAYQESGRVCLVEEALDCCQLKHIISQCRFMIGGRTHAMIAAYSSMVPGLALSYSDKSVAIAQDLFGDGQLVLRRGELGQLWQRFSLLRQQEAALRAHYRAVLPDYCESIRTAVSRLLEE